MSGKGSSAKGMIFLETSHPILEETLNTKLAAGAKQEPVDVTCCDFDEVRYRIQVTSSEKNILNFQLEMPFLKAILPFGGQELFDGMYGPYKSDEKAEGYDACFKINVDDHAEKGEVIAKNFAEIKRNLVGAPFHKAFQALLNGSSGSLKPMVIPFRPLERVVIVPGSDRVTVYFSIEFLDETDRAIGRVFLQEFSESQRKIPQAPKATFMVDCPADLAKVAEFKPKDDVLGYVMFQVFKSHVEGPKMEKAITMFQMFRAYLLYHIKASKAMLHARMRSRVDLLLQVLKRADPTAAQESQNKKNYRTY
mmetsp:Transcript_20029/g.33055  ORF Transcript_20029/g.33055 Transcript_20029/m.33055 type:complete len:308 (+) Transcript_20029:56-979(+)